MHEIIETHPFGIMLVVDFGANPAQGYPPALVFR
jgi:hypothetical protein